jgi:hypothetical protein
MNWKGLLKGATGLGAVTATTAANPTLGWVLVIVIFGRAVAITAGIVALVWLVDRRERKVVISDLAKSLIKLLIGQ